MWVVLAGTFQTLPFTFCRQDSVEAYGPLFFFVQAELCDPRTQEACLERRGR